MERFKTLCCAYDTHSDLGDVNRWLTVISAQLDSTRLSWRFKTISFPKWPKEVDIISDAKTWWTHQKSKNAR